MHKQAEMVLLFQFSKRQSVQLIICFVGFTASVGIIRNEIKILFIRHYIPHSPDIRNDFIVIFRFKIKFNQCIPSEGGNIQTIFVIAHS